MNILDENIFFDQREILRLRKVHFRQIGVEIGHAGMKDRNEIIPLLHSLRRPTLFTSDQDFYRLDWRHAGYCLVYLDVPPDETAEFIRRFLRHKVFRAQAQRMGCVIRVRQSGLTCWQVGLEAERIVGW